MPNDEWTRFSINQDTGSQLKTISHVAHMHHAIEILKEGHIRAGLIYDKSRLNTSRIMLYGCHQMIGLALVDSDMEMFASLMIGPR